MVTVLNGLKKLAPVLLLAIASNAFAEVVFTKDGKLYQGTSVTETATGYTLTTKDGFSRNFKKAEVLRVKYGEGLPQARYYYMNAKGQATLRRYGIRSEYIYGYMVEEWEKDYIVRPDLYRNREIRIKKANVDAITRKRQTTKTKYVYIGPNKPNYGRTSSSWESGTWMLNFSFGVSFSSTYALSDAWITDQTSGSSTSTTTYNGQDLANAEVEGGSEFIFDTRILQNAGGFVWGFGAAGHKTPEFSIPLTLENSGEALPKTSLDISGETLIRFGGIIGGYFDIAKDWSFLILNGYYYSTQSVDDIDSFNDAYDVVVDSTWRALVINFDLFVQYELSNWFIFAGPRFEFMVDSGFEDFANISRNGPAVIVTVGGGYNL